MEKIRWGILSTGGIAHTVCRDLRNMDDAEIFAVGSRSQASADAFGDEFNVPRRYDSYEALVADPDVDVIYVATPHAFHHENMLLCLNAGKHVLCEKPFTINAKQAEEVIKLAREKNLFVMEAMWTRYFPVIIKLNDLIAEGAIGDVKRVIVDFSFYKEYEAGHRLFDPKLGGGALLDVGIYTISFAAMILGIPQTVKTHAILGQSGVDESTSIIMGYDNGAAALLSCGFQNRAFMEVLIHGSGGTIRVHETFYRPHTITVHSSGKDPQVIEMPYEGIGYQFELQEVMDCIRAGKTESARMPLDETLALMQLMDGIREEWGLRYPGE